MALNKPSTQSSRHTPDKHEPKYANDGDVTTGTVTKCRTKSKKWVQIELQKLYHIQRIVFHGAPSAFEKNLYKNINVETRRTSSPESWILCKRISNMPTNPFSFQCDTPTDASVVRFTFLQDHARCFYVREIEVYAECTYDDDEDSPCKFPEITA